MSTIKRLGDRGFGVKDLAAWKRLSTQVVGSRSVGHTEDGRPLIRMAAARK